MAPLHLALLVALPPGIKLHRLFRSSQATIRIVGVLIRTGAQRGNRIGTSGSLAVYLSKTARVATRSYSAARSGLTEPRLQSIRSDLSTTTRIAKMAFFWLFDFRVGRKVWMLAKGRDRPFDRLLSPQLGEGEIRFLRLCIWTVFGHGSSSHLKLPNLYGSQAPFDRFAVGALTGNRTPVNELRTRCPSR